MQGIEKNCIQLRNEDEIDGDDHSGNYITITNDGTLYINCWDLRSLLRVDLNKKTFDYQADLSNLQNELCQISLEQSEGPYLLFTGSWGNCKLYDPNKKELKFELNPDKSGISLESKAFHYDLKSDTLFIYDYDSKIHCILHPSWIRPRTGRTTEVQNRL